MRIDEKTWQDIKAEIRVAIERLNATAAEWGVKGVFSFTCEQRGDSVVLICTRTETSMQEIRSLARDAGTGEVLFAELAFSFGESWLARFTARLPVPSEWKLADLSASQIVKRLRLLHFSESPGPNLSARPIWDQAEIETRNVQAKEFAFRILERGHSSEMAERRGGSIFG